MIDGILDLLAAILVLGVVVAIAFGFILPLTDGDIMQYTSKYEDKATLNTIIEYDDPDSFNSLIRRTYSYEELVLLLSVQDSRMEEPKGLNMRNLVIDRDLRADGYKNKNLNEIASTDRILQAIQYYGENSIDMVYLTYSDKPNVGVLRFTENYGLTVDEMCSFLTKSSLSNCFTNRLDWTEEQQLKGDVLENTDKRYFIGYQFAIPSDSTYLNGNADFEKNYNNEDIYIVNIDGNWQPTSHPIDTLELYKSYVDLVREYVTE